MGVVCCFDPILLACLQDCRKKGRKEERREGESGVVIVVSDSLRMNERYAMLCKLCESVVGEY